MSIWLAECGVVGCCGQWGVQNIQGQIGGDRLVYLYVYVYVFIYVLCIYYMYVYWIWYVWRIFMDVLVGTGCFICKYLYMNICLNLCLLCVYIIHVYILQMNKSLMICFYADACNRFDQQLSGVLRTQFRHTVQVSDR